MKISIGSDHGGYILKQELIAYLRDLGHQVLDCGCPDTASCDYPEFGEAAARAVASGDCERGIVVCTTGIGISISANKVKGIRCALCGDPWSAEMTRRHNDANMLAIGAAVTAPDTAKKLVDIFLSTEFEGGRHQRRVDKLMAIEGR